MDTLISCLKTDWWSLYPIIACLFVYLNLSAEAYLILATLLAMDTLTGVIKAIVIWDKPTSSKMWNGVIAKCTMLLIPLCVALLAKQLNPTVVNLNAFVSVCISALSLAEFYSFLQNIVSIKKWKKIEEYDAITEVIRYIQNFIKNLISKSTDDKPTRKESA